MRELADHAAATRTGAATGVYSGVQQLAARTEPYAEPLAVLQTYLAGLDRRTLASVLTGLGAWLIEQGHMLEQDPLRGQRLHVVPPLLTQREREVAERIAAGASNRQIAHELVISNGTVERHVANILSKLGMRSRAQVAVWWVREGC
jgi:DNA-binding NarL/FixJ family response regulator